jgi:hypothetical protein
MTLLEQSYKPLKWDIRSVTILAVTLSKQAAC